MSCLTAKEVPGKRQSALLRSGVLKCKAPASPLLPLVLPSGPNPELQGMGRFLFTQRAHGPALCALRSPIRVTINTEPTTQEGLRGPYIPLLYHSGCSRGARTWLCPYLSKLQQVPLQSIANKQTADLVPALILSLTGYRLTLSQFAQLWDKHMGRMRNRKRASTEKPPVSPSVQREVNPVLDIPLPGPDLCVSREGAEQVPGRPLPLRAFRTAAL